MKLFFTEHNHDADNLANMEEHEHKIAEGVKKIAVEVDSNIQRWEGDCGKKQAEVGAASRSKKLTRINGLFSARSVFPLRCAPPCPLKSR